MISKVEQWMEEGISRGVFPAASLLIGIPRQILFDEHFGQAREGTCFDIASLTKAVSTATLAMQLVAEDLLKLDQTLPAWLPKARQPFHAKITIAHLLSHRAGLPAWQPYFRQLPLDRVGTEEGRQFILKSCLEEEAFYEPGTQCLYSDIGYILLGELLAQAGLAPLDVLFRHRVCLPLGLKDTFFVRNMGSPVSLSRKHGYASAAQHIPRGTPVPSAEKESSSIRKRFAPTEDCPWRERIVHGEVHDPNAYAMGGVAGHAGLFSTTKDLNQFVTELVRAYHGESDFIPQPVVRTFLEAPHAPGTFVLGWDTPSSEGSSSGRFFSKESVGHLGYTGCSLWIDLKKNFWIILLTNRIHPTATNETIRTFRPVLHDLVYQEWFEKG